MKKTTHNTHDRDKISVAGLHPKLANFINAVYNLCEDCQYRDDAEIKRNYFLVSSIYDCLKQYEADLPKLFTRFEDEKTTNFLTSLAKTMSKRKHDIENFKTLYRRVNAPAVKDGAVFPARKAVRADVNKCFNFLFNNSFDFESYLLLAKSDLLVHGFLREHEKKLGLQIPEDLKKPITEFYCGK